MFRNSIYITLNEVMYFLYVMFVNLCYEYLLNVNRFIIFGDLLSADYRFRLKKYFPNVLYFA